MSSTPRGIRRWWDNAKQAPLWALIILGVSLGATLKLTALGLMDWLR